MLAVSVRPSGGRRRDRVLWAGPVELGGGGGRVCSEARVRVLSSGAAAGSEARLCRVTRCEDVAAAAGRERVSDGSVEWAAVVAVAVAARAVSRPGLAK